MKRFRSVLMFTSACALLCLVGCGDGPDESLDAGVSQAVEDTSSLVISLDQNQWNPDDTNTAPLFIELGSDDPGSSSSLEKGRVVVTVETTNGHFENGQSSMEVEVWDGLGDVDLTINERIETEVVVSHGAKQTKLIIEF